MTKGHKIPHLLHNIELNEELKYLYVWDMNGHDVIYDVATLADFLFRESDLLITNYKGGG